MKLFLLFLAGLMGLLSCKSEPMEEIVVIGGGLMGSSTAWELALSGKKVLLAEQQGPAYSFGSSFGDARISRYLGPEEDIFSYLQATSVEETAKLITYLNEHSDTADHRMSDIYTTSPVTYIYYSAKEVQPLLENKAVRIEYAANASEARSMFNMEIPDTARVIREFREFSGTLNPRVLIQKLHAGIKMAGGRVQYYQKVTGLTRMENHYQLEITDIRTGAVRTILSRQVVAAAGPYNGRLVRDVAPYFEQLITPKRLFLTFLKIRDEVYSRLSADEKHKIKMSYPVADINDEIFYSMIEKYDEEGAPLLKVGGHLLRSDVDNLDSIWNKELSEAEIAWSKSNTSRYLNYLGLSVAPDDLEFMRGYSCVYSLTGNETPYVTHVLDEAGDPDTNFILVGGMSGIGAKGSLTYGLIASDLLLGRSDSSKMYLKTRNALGVERLKEDLEDINNSRIQAYRWH